jgi:hypothetical protein
MWIFRFEGQPRQGGQLKKLLQICFKEIKENYAMLDRSRPTREALDCSIPISEVKDMKSDVLRALKASLLEKKNFEPYLDSQF